MNMREFILKTITDLAPVKPAHEIREMALGWYSKGVLTEDDLATIEGMLPSYGTTLEEAQATKQFLNNQALKIHLKENPLTWEDGEQYSVTEDDQNKMMRNYMSWKLGIHSKLEWNSHTKKCKEFTEEEFLRLSTKIAEFVAPRLAKCQDYKEQIYDAQSVEAVKAISFDYSTVGQEDGMDA